MQKNSYGVLINTFFQFESELLSLTRVSFQSDQWITLEPSELEQI